VSRAVLALNRRQSPLSTLAGCTRAARRAGSQVAASETSARIAAAPASARRAARVDPVLALAEE